MPRAPAPQMSRRLPTEEQARLVKERAREILSDWEAFGLPPLSAIEVGPVRLEFRQGEGAEAKPWRGKRFGGGG